LTLCLLNHRTRTWVVGASTSISLL